jgi:predicted kinase
VLIVLTGLPAAGKSAVGEDLARALLVPVLSVDPIETAMWQAGVDRRQPTGLAAYQVVEAIAEELLALDLTVIVDAVDDAVEARQQWQALAVRRQVELRYVEVVCPDRWLHQRRLESRRRGLDGFPEPPWEAVEARRSAFEQWTGDRLVLDSTRPRQANLDAALSYLIVA